MKYSYPLEYKKTEDDPCYPNGVYEGELVDFFGCYPCGETFEEMMEDARGMLAFVIECALIDGLKLPTPSQGDTMVTVDVEGKRRTI